MSNLWSKVFVSASVLNSLQKIYSRGSFPPAIIFYGPKGIGKDAIALAFSQSVNCTVSDNFYPCGECDSCYKTINFLPPAINYIFPLPPSAFSKDDNSLSFTEKLSEQLKQFFEKKKIILT